MDELEKELKLEEKEIKEAKILITIDNFRIKKITRNLVLEQYREVINSKTKEKRMDWCLEGYYNTFANILSVLIESRLQQNTYQSINELIKTSLSIKNEVIEAVKTIDEKLVL